LIWSSGEYRALA